MYFFCCFLAFRARNEQFWGLKWSSYPMDTLDKCVFLCFIRFSVILSLFVSRGKCISFVRVSLLLLLYSLLFYIIFIFDCYGPVYEYCFIFCMFISSFCYSFRCVKVTFSLCSDHWFLLDFSSFLLFSGVLFFLTRFLQWIWCLKGVLRSFLQEMTSKRGEGSNRTLE